MERGDKTMAKKPKTGLTTKHWFGYMFGDFGGCMTFALMGSIVTMYYTDILHVNTVTLAALLFIWNIWDAVNDPLMGALMDKMFARNKNPKGKFRPWLLRATPLVAITAAAFWTVPTFFEGTTMLVVLFLCKILYEATYTMFNIPMGSLLSAMSTNDAERASLSSARGVGSMIGNMIPAMAAPMIIAHFGDDNSIGYSIAGIVCAAIGFVICFLHYAMTEERNTLGAETKADDIKFADILEVFKKNRPFVALCIHGICICTMQYVGQTLGGYMYKDVYGDLSLQSFATMLSTPIMVLSMIVVPFICKKLGLEKFIRYSLLVGGSMYVVLYALHMVMDVPVVLHILLSGLAMGTAMISIQMQWGLVGEAIDYNEMVTGKRTEGSIYGTFNLTRRIGQTIGNSAAVLALGWIGYNDAAGAVQTAATLDGITILCVLVPAVFVLGSWAAFKFVWNITPEVRAEMAAKKNAAAAKQAQ